MKVFLRTSSPDTKVVVVVKLVEVAINVVVVERNADARAWKYHEQELGCSTTTSRNLLSPLTPHLPHHHHKYHQVESEIPAESKFQGMSVKGKVKKWTSTLTR